MIDLGEHARRARLREQDLEERRDLLWALLIVGVVLVLGVLGGLVWAALS